MTPLIALFLVGCAPHDAEMTGNWVTWLPQGSSNTVKGGEVDLSGADTIDCSGRVEGDPGYLGNSDSSYNCDDLASLEYNTWLTSDGYYRLQSDLQPTRTEAVVNSEGDFQLTVHQELDSGQDFRFAFSIKPDFAPVECSSDANGDPEIVYVDGQNWLDEWSADEDGYKIYYLDAGAYQINPEDSNDYWSLTTDMLAGYGAAKFAADSFGSQATAYAWSDPNAENGSSCNPVGVDRLFYYSFYFTECENPGTSTADGLLAAMGEDLVARTPTWSAEMVDLYGAPSFDFKVEDNTWREIDDAHQGLDGWAGVSTSWVRIKDGADLEVGGQAEGDFQIVYEAVDSDSHILVTGTFKVDKIGEDTWGYPELEDQKREENGTPYCGGASMP